MSERGGGMFAVWQSVDMGLPATTDTMCVWASDDEVLLIASLDKEKADCFTNPRSALYGATRYIECERLLDLHTVTPESAARAAVIQAIDAGDDE